MPCIPIISEWRWSLGRQVYADGKDSNSFHIDIQLWPVAVANLASSANNNGVEPAEPPFLC
jgi:hypothetical protein